MSDFTRQPGGGGDAAVGRGAGGLPLAALLIHGLAASVQPFTRVPGSCGHNYFGITALVGWLVPCLLFGACRTEGERQVATGFVGALTLLLLVHRLGSLVRYGRRDAPHSMYVGDSWLSRLLPRLPVDHCRGPAEWTLCLIVGSVLTSASPVLGQYVMAAGTASYLSLILIHARDERRLERMRDQHLEGRDPTDRFGRRVDEE